jgi:outer membrane protein insertion porin family
MRAQSLSAFIVLSAILIGGLAALPASAQAPTPSAVIKEIHATGSTHYTEAQIVALSGLKPGAPITLEHLQAVANYMAQLGIFSRVNYRFTTRDADTNLEFQIEDGPVVPVWFDNFPWFSEAELMNSISLAVPLFNGLAPQDGSLLDDISGALTLLLQTNKIPGTIERTLLAKPGSDDQIMQFRVVGPTLTIASLAYTDPLAQNSPKLADRKLDIVGKPFSRFAVEMFVSEQVRPLYLTSGHLRASFGAPEPRFTGDPNLPLPTQVSVTLPIDAGPAFKLGEVTWSGNTVLNRAPLDLLVNVKRGEIADGMALTGVWQRVEREYARRGYIDAKVNPQPEYSDAAGTVAFRVAISEGPQYRMGKLVITGLSLDAERSLRVAWKLAPGDIFDGAYVEDMMAKLEKPTPDIFGRLPLHYSEVGHLLTPSDAPNTMDVLIDFQR